MNAPVGLRIVSSNSFQTGLGNFNHKGSYEIIVRNLSYDKKVSIWAYNGSSWRDIPGEFVESLPGNLEKWQVTANENDFEFAVKFIANGITYWDTNKGRNYKFPRAHDAFNALSGSNFPIVFGNISLSNSKLKAHVAVQNLGYNKVVGLIYTVDNWATHQSVSGLYSWTMGSGMEVWSIEQQLESLSEVQVACFYKINGCEYWDNNFHKNYTILPQRMELSTDDSDSSKRDMWEPRPQKIIPRKVKKVQESVVSPKIKILESELLPTD